MKRRGLSLAETVLATTLAGMMLVLIINLFPSSMATVRKAELRLRAATLADSLLEQKSVLPFSKLPVGLSQETEEKPFHLTFTVVKVDAENDSYLRELRVKVQWEDRGVKLELTRKLYKHRLPSQL